MITKPKGTNDLYGLQAKKMNYINDVLTAVCEKYHYEFIRTPVFEASELFHRGVGEGSDIVRKETYDFKDRGERDITLRPEGTAGVVRSYIENKMYGNDLQPIKLYYNEMMYRYERPQSGRLREFNQFGVEVLGCDDPFVDAEVISLAYNMFKLLGLKNIRVNINSLGDKESRDNYREALVQHFSKDVANMCEDCQERLKKNPLRILDCKVDQDKEIMKSAPKMIDYLNEKSKARFAKLQEYLDLLDIEYVVNPQIVRGLDYYNHTVFEIEMLSENFGSQNVLSAGGRYNGLVEMLDGPETPGIGFAMGLERVLLALEEEEVNLPINNEVDVFVGYVNDEEKDTALYLVQDLRLNGFIVETDYLARSLKSQFKTADKLNSKYVIILNSDDIKNFQVNVRDNKTKEEQKVAINDLVDYLDMNM